MDSKYPPEAWQRLGKALEQLRGELGFGYRRRPAFLAERGASELRPSLKMIERLERGARGSYPGSTVARLESMYWLRPGSFEAYLAAVTRGDEDAAGKALRPDPALLAAPLDRSEQVIHRILHAGDQDLRVLRHMDQATSADGTLLPWADRLHMMEEWLAATADSAGPAEETGPDQDLRRAADAPA